MKKTQLLLVILMLFGASNAQAFYAGGNLVNHIHQSEFTTYIKLGEPMHNPAGCVGGTFWYSIARTDPRHDDYVKLALTALASGKVLSVYLHDTECDWNAPKITGLTINR